jgi:hypothetical protein
MGESTRVSRRTQNVVHKARSIVSREGYALAKPAIGANLNGHRRHHIGNLGEKSTHGPKYAGSVWHSWSQSRIGGSSAAAGLKSPVLITALLD